MKLSLVIPAYNESSIIEATLHTVTARLAEMDPDYELLIVDDGSTDNMADLVRPFAGEHVRLTGYHPNGGKGKAVRTGMLEARGDYVFCTDADLAYGLENIPPMLDKLAAGADLLDKLGYQGYPPIRLLTSKVFGLLVRLFSGLPYDTQCGIKGYRHDAAQAIFSRCSTDGFAFDFEVLLRARKLGLTVEQEAVHVVNHRESKINILRDSARMFRDIFRIRRLVARA